MSYKFREVLLFINFIKRNKGNNLVCEDNLELRALDSQGNIVASVLLIIKKFPPDFRERIMKISGITIRFN